MDGDRAVQADAQVIRVVDRTTGLVVQEHIPQVIQYALRLMYKSIWGHGMFSIHPIKHLLRRLSVRPVYCHGEFRAVWYRLIESARWQPLMWYVLWIHPTASRRQKNGRSG